MFTIDQIKEAHAKVQTGADFIRYVQELVKMGVARYDTYVSDGHTAYLGKNDYHVQSDSSYPPIEVASKSDPSQFKHYLKIHQMGETSYPVFCEHSARTGVEKWTVDMTEMTCTYYDKEGNKMLVEKITAN